MTVLGGSSFAQLNASEKFLYVNTTPRLSSSPAKELPPPELCHSEASEEPCLLKYRGMKR